MAKGKVYVQFPRTGLGNMMLTWTRGYLFAHLNELPLVASSWGKVQWGAWLRWERKKRTYWGYFRESSLAEKIKTRWQKRKAQIIVEPSVEKMADANKNDALYVFDQVSPGKDLFGPFRAHRDLVKKAIFDQLHPTMRGQLERYQAPVIALHIRRGDFKLGNPITPDSFFINAILLAREVAGKELPATIFTDAAPEEIKDVLSLPGVVMSEDKPDILDILLMSKSKMIVLSQSSTFSYWGAFLSDAAIVRPAGDWQGELRPADVNEHIFEGKVDFRDTASVQRLREGLLTVAW
ncbi:hypothetical protein Q4E93_26305 [Flavitalea sp. BT771]|uniref:hypothetical protein n=1 Tax=Flavitalea sp. BT771 TaxID=3063329 RepID=UPI0026E3AD10|nr:hypothetical protein [Flavitalea sp. BT771]MDO6434149.1 hypothetical protein [Flavitalea sp. BT771]MDV6223049.1 hypothetical protein [Flavitalea sp. BT771]